MSEPIRLNFEHAGDSKNPPLLLLHGFGGDSRDWSEEIFEKLTDSFYCLAPDLPGHGRSVFERDEDYLMRKSAAQVVELLDQQSIDTCHLVGYSMGGRLALFLAVRYPDRFQKVVVESGTPGLGAEFERQGRIAEDLQLANQLRKDSIEKFFECWFQQPVFQTLDRDSARFKRMLARRLENDPEGLARSLMFMGTGRQPSLWDELHKITADLLLIVGEQDSKFRQTANLMVGLVGRARVAAIEGAGHNVHFEKQDEYIELLRQFLKQ